MFKYLFGLTFRDSCDEWSHKLTGGIGVGFALAPTVDTITRVLGALAIVVSIWASIRRERRESRAARFQEELRRTASAPALTVFPPPAA